MSGSRGEANFVWKCKNCKVRLSSSPPVIRTLTPCSGNRRLPSRLPQSRMSRQSLPRPSGSLSLTAADWSLWNSSQRYAKATKTYP